MSRKNNEKGENKMEFKPNFNGISKLIKFGIPILGLLVLGPVGCIAGLLIASCVCITQKDNE